MQNVEPNKKPDISFRLSSMLRRQDSNLRPLGYEPNELPLLHSAMYLYVCGYNPKLYFNPSSPLFSIILVFLERAQRYFKLGEKQKKLSYLKEKKPLKSSAI